MASSISSAPASAEKTGANPAREITIPAGSLRSALDSLARQTGISIGMAGILPATSTRKTVRARDVAQALQRVLAGTRLRAVRVDTTTWRIEPLPVAPIRVRLPRTPPPIVEGGDIIVTASKRDERLSDLPASISILGGPALDHLAGKRGLVDLLATTDGAFSTNLGPGRDRVFLRGVADSAFNGTSQSLVSLYLDDARIGYSSPDPDLRMVDIDRVEILRGPQGTLYGTGALGGVIRIVTTAPDLDEASGRVAGDVTATNNGAVGGAFEGVEHVYDAPGRVEFTLDGQDLAPERVKAAVAPVEAGDHAALRINLYALGGGAPLATIDKPVDLADDLEIALEDLCDALATVGLDGILVATGFDDDGEPQGAEPYLTA